MKHCRVPYYRPLLLSIALAVMLVPITGCGGDSSASSATTDVAPITIEGPSRLADYQAHLALQQKAVQAMDAAAKKAKAAGKEWDWSKQLDAVESFQREYKNLPPVTYEVEVSSDYAGPVEIAYARAVSDGLAGLKMGFDGQITATVEFKVGVAVKAKFPDGQTPSQIPGQVTLELIDADGAVVEYVTVEHMKKDTLDPGERVELRQHGIEFDVTKILRGMKLRLP